MSAALGVLLRMALRNLVVHRVKSGVVGAIMFFGVFLVVSGTAMLDSIRASMEKSITSSLSGNIQVYSSEAEDELALFGSMAMGASDIGEIDEFAPLRELLLGIDGVKAALLRELTPRDVMADADQLAAALKALPLGVSAARPIDEAISSAGGVRFEALDDALMLKALPGVFCAGEMLDWEAPTGGYLLTACLASGVRAGLGVVRWAGQTPVAH